MAVPGCPQTGIAEDSATSTHDTPKTVAPVRPISRRHKDLRCNAPTRSCTQGPAGEPQLTAHLGLSPKVHQSGNSAPVHGRSAGRPCSRPWPARRSRLVGQPGAGTAARLLPADQGPPRIPNRHRRDRPQDDHPGLARRHQRPGLRLRPPRRHKRRKLELATGGPSRRGNFRTPDAAYNDKQRRTTETAAVEQAERAYEVFVAHWQPHNPAKTRAGT